MSVVDSLLQKGFGDQTECEKDPQSYACVVSKGGGGIIAKPVSDLNTNTGINGEKSMIEKAIEPVLIGGGAIPLKKGYTDDFYYSKIGIDGAQLKISERLKKWNDGDVAKANGMIPDSVIHPDPTVKMAKTTSEIDDAIMVEMERRGLITSGDTYKRNIKMQSLKSKGLALLAIIFVVGAIYFAYKKYPNATKWVVIIAIGLYVLLGVSIWLFFTWGGESNYDKYFAKYLGHFPENNAEKANKAFMANPLPKMDSKDGKLSTDKGLIYTT